MIAVNGRFLTQRTTGVQRFGREITKALGAIREDILVLTPRRSADLTQITMPTHPVGLNSGHLWEQVDLPLFLRRSLGSPLLVNFSATGPLSYRRQISTHHDVTFIRYPGSFSTPFRSVYRIASPMMIRRNRAAITVSDFSRHELIREFHLAPDQLTVVPNAPSVAFESNLENSGSTRSPGYLLAVSSAAPHKNLAMLLRAFDRSTVPEQLRLKVVGCDAGEGRALTPAVKRDVDFLGNVTDTELASLYRGAVALVLPSLYEGFGLPAIEAQSCGCPVIASDIPALREVLDSSASFFDPTNPISLANAIDRVVDDTRFRHGLQEAGTTNVARFSWHRSAAILSELIDTAVEQDQEVR